MLKRIAEILPEVWKDLEELNKRFDEREKKNGRTDVLPTSDARTGNARSCPYKCEGDNK